MSISEAKKILNACRPHGGDATDPQVAEAMKLAAEHPGLKAWFEEQQAFDARLANALQQVTAPSDLKAEILAKNRVVISRPTSWWRPIVQDWRPRVAVAAVLVLSAVFTVSSQRTSGGFGEFRQELIDEGWAGDTHLDFESQDWMKIRQWLARQGAPSDFDLPKPLERLNLHGCRLVKMGSQQVALLCVTDGSKHLHLFVADNVEFADLPPDGAPDFEKCGLWKTAAWRQGNRTFVLSGMNFHTFVNTFRKSGRWTMSG
jgi:hypothetical protein